MTSSPRRLEWSDRAIEQLSRIVEYFKEQASEASAARFAARVQVRAREIAAFPLAGTIMPGRDRSVRRTTVGAYVVLYQVESARPVVRILSIRHGRQRPLTFRELAALLEPDD